jgi:hypothetical protein
VKPAQGVRPHRRAAVRAQAEQLGLRVVVPALSAVGVRIEEKVDRITLSWPKDQVDRTEVEESSVPPVPLRAEVRVPVLLEQPSTALKASRAAGARTVAFTFVTPTATKRIVVPRGRSACRDRCRSCLLARSTLVERCAGWRSTCRGPWSGAGGDPPAVFAEVSIGFQRIENLEQAVPPALFRREALPFEGAFLAGKCFLEYRRRGGAKAIVLPDLYIGAHAAVAAYRLLTRDGARY